ncbi:hypothetical protein [Salinispora arenicola]|uniref:hypothetical protein n=1 Tax=Salinispora arenicola TaxID=168697 RepID=UPI00039D5B99|nr:hypothetical protein [Salinispora arenicola]
MSRPQPRRGRRHRRLDRPAFVALLLGTAGVGYRLVLMLFTIPASNSDEATFGLAALHIAAGTERPVFLYGQQYMGTVESYLAAPLLGLLGPSWPVLRLPLLALYALFLWLIHRLTRRIGSPWFATLIVGLLALGPERVVRDQLTVVGGRPEGKVAVLLMLLVVVGLARQTIRHRRLAVGLFGLLAGVSFWSDWLILPYVGAITLALLWAARRDLLGWAGALLVAGFTLGIAPMIGYYRTAGPGSDPLSVLRGVIYAADDEPSPPLVQRFSGAVLEGVPLATGLCPAPGCGRWTEWFGLLYLALLVIATVVAVVAYRRAAGRAARVAPVVHLALVLGAALTLLSYARSPLAATDPLGNARYLALLHLSLPAVLWPPWQAAVQTLRSTAGVLGRLVGTLAAAFLAALAATALLVTVLFTTTDTAVARADERAARGLADTLRAVGPHEVYGAYWTCNRLTFNTDEEVACGVLDDELTPGQNRYPAYWDRVAAADRPGYVVEIGSMQEQRLRRLLGDQADAAVVADVEKYRVYHPQAPVRPWR